MSLGTPVKKAAPPRGERSQNIQVFVRVRPLNEQEKASRSYSILEAPDSKRLVVKEKPSSSQTKTFGFNGVFDAEVPQGPVYARVVKPLVDQVLKGYNCTVFAYGQTGTGKTHTMEGVPETPEAGVIPRALNDLFDGLRVASTKDFAVRVSYLELYNEEIFDLLSEVNDTSRLRLFEDSNKKGSVIIQGLEELQVRSKEEVISVLKKGSLKRQTASTLMNANSSRSHTVFTVTVLINQASVGDEETIKIGKLNLVDLAGSENVGRSGAQDKRAREAGNINQSLLTLGRVISSLVERTPHVPYRESKLTRLLQDSLGGRTKTSIIATVSPAIINLEETLSTLDYAHRAKSITNKPEVNQRICKNEQLLDYTNQINRLKSELQVAREKSGVYMTEDNYRGMVKKDESQEKEINTLIEKIGFLENESEKVKDMFASTKARLEETTKERDATLETLECTRSVLFQTSVEKEEQEHLVAKHVETECKLQKQANTLLTVSDESTRDLSGVHDKLDRVRNIELQNENGMNDFHSSFLSRYNRLEESFQGQIMEQSKFCAQTRDTLNTLLYERNGYKVQTSEGLTLAMDSIVNLITDIEKSVSDNIYEEQAWVNSQMQQARNAADGQQKRLQVYLTDKVLPQLVSISTAIADQRSATQEASSQVHNLVNSQVDKWEKHIQDQNKLNSQSLELIQSVGASKDKHLKDLQVNQEGLKAANNVLEKDFATLLSSVQNFSSKLKSHTVESNKAVEQNVAIIEAIGSEESKMISGVQALSLNLEERSNSRLYELAQESSAIRSKQDYLLNSVNKAFGVIAPAEQALSRESKDFVSSAQDELERQYSNLERDLRQKSDASADHLKLLNAKTQDVRTSTLDSQRSLEERLEAQRSEDERNTVLLKESVETHCKVTESFGKSHGNELRESGQSVSRYVTEDFKRDVPTNFTPVRKPPRAYPNKIMSGTPDPVRLQRFRDARAPPLPLTEDSIPDDDDETDADSAISANTMQSEDFINDENTKITSGEPHMSLSRQNSLEKSAIPVMNFRRPLSSVGSRSRSASSSRAARKKNAAAN